MSTDQLSALNNWSLSLFSDYLPNISWKAKFSLKPLHSKPLEEKLAIKGL
jgi:hypothetical protein